MSKCKVHSGNDATFQCGQCGFMFCDDCSGGVLNNKKVCGDCYIKGAAEEVKNDRIEKEIERSSRVYKPKQKTMLPILVIILLLLGSISMYVYVNNRPAEITNDRIEYFHEMEASQIASWVYEYHNEKEQLPEGLDQLKQLNELEIDTDLLEKFAYIKIDEKRFTLKTSVEIDNRIRDLSFSYPDENFLFGVKIPIKEQDDE